MLGGVAGIAHYSTGDEQTQYNRVHYLNLFGTFLPCKVSNYSELIYFVTVTLNTTNNLSILNSIHAYIRISRKDEINRGYLPI